MAAVAEKGASRARGKALHAYLKELRTWIVDHNPVCISHTHAHTHKSIKEIPSAPLEVITPAGALHHPMGALEPK
eukprot:44748-Pyramimonas_sp.AAC.1